jgi:hypothetical protein
MSSGGDSTDPSILDGQRGYRQSRYARQMIGDDAAMAFLVISFKAHQACAMAPHERSVLEVAAHPERMCFENFEQSVVASAGGFASSRVAKPA